MMKDIPMPLLWLSLAFLTGILLASILPLSTWLWGLLMGLALAFTLLQPRLLRLRFVISLQPRFTLPAWIPHPPIPFSLIVASLLFGAFRYQLYLPRFSPGFIAWYNDTGGTMVVEGVVVRPPESRDSYTSLIVQVRQLFPQENPTYIPVKGRLLAQVLPGEDWHYGDYVRLVGQLVTPPESEDFSYRKYLSLQRVFSLMQRPAATRLDQGQGNPLLAVIYHLRERAVVTVYRLYPDPEASLLAGILLGSESGIPLAVQEAFKVTGTSHIIAISGANITVLVALFSTLFRRVLKRWWNLLGMILFIIFYTILVGGDATVVRAAIMGSLSLIAVQLGRRQDGVNLLAIAALGMALIKPDILWDVGFQLSFFATLGMVLFSEPFSEAFTRLASRFIPTNLLDRLVGPVSEYLLFTLAAQLFTLPIIVYHFQRLSLVSLLANPLILPAQPPVMALGGLSVLVGLLIRPLGQGIAYLAWPFVAYTIRLVEWMAGFPLASLSVGHISLFWIIVSIGMLLLLAVTGKRLRDWLPALRPAVLLTGLTLLTLLTWRVASSAPDGRLHITLFDVGEGDALLIQTPAGRSLLVNGGPSTSRLSDSLGRRLPVDRRLDWLVVAAPIDEQLAALPGVLDRYPPAQVLWAGTTAASRSARLLQEKLVTSRIPVTLAETGQELDLGQGASLRLLIQGEQGGIFVLEWGDFRLLLPVGAAPDDLAALRNGKAVGQVTALLLAGNGIASLNPTEWFGNLNPQVVLLSVEAGNLHGLPSPETVEVLQSYTVLRTDRNGWIRLTTDGRQMWIEVERK